MNNYVYMVRVAYSTDESDGIVTHLYKNFNDAVTKYYQIIHEECEPENSWVGNEVFNEYGEVNEGYTVDYNEYEEREMDLYWTVVDDYNYNRHTFIDLMKLEVL